MVTHEEDRQLLKRQISFSEIETKAEKGEWQLVSPP